MDPGGSPTHTFIGVIVSNDYIPAEDGKTLTFLETFEQGIAADPAAYQLSISDSASITNAVNIFAAAYADSQDPAERTAVTVNLKDEARNSAVAICRQYATAIKFNAGISNALKIAIGVKPVNTSRQPIVAPSTSPLLNVIGATPGAQTIRYADSNTPESGAKPFGALQLQLFVAVGAAPIGDPELAKFYGAFTRNPVGIPFDFADDGKMATYFGRWSTRKGEVGPWSLPVSMRIAA